MSDDKRLSNGMAADPTASRSSNYSRASVGSNGRFSSPVKRMSSVGTKEYRKSWYDPALTDPKFSTMSMTSLLLKDWALYFGAISFCAFYVAIQALFMNVKHSMHCTWIPDPIIWQLDFILFIAGPALTSLMLSLKFFEREEYAFSFKEYVAIWFCGLSAVVVMNMYFYTINRRDNPSIFFTMLLTAVFITCCVIRVKRAKVNAVDEQTFKDCKEIVMRHFVGIALVNVCAGTRTGFPILTTTGFGFVRAKVNEALGCLISGNGEVKCGCADADDGNKLKLEKCAEGFTVALGLLNVFNVVFVTLFFSLVMPLFCRVMGTWLFDPMGRLMSGNRKTKDDTVLMKRNRFWLNVGFDGFRFLFGRGLLLTLGSVELFILFLVKDLFYHFFHFGLKFQSYAMEFTIATFHPELSIKDKWFKRIAKGIELTVRFMGIPKKIARAWTIPFDYNTVLVDRGLVPVLPKNDDIKVEEDKDGEPVVRKLSTESIETSIALSFCNTAVVVYNFPRKVEGILERGRSVRVSGSQDLMSANEMYKEDLVEMDQAQLDEFVSFMQTQIFLRYQARALAKLCTSIPFLLVPYIGSLGNGQTMHSFKDELALLQPEANPAAVDEGKAAQFAFTGMLFLITDLAEYLLLMFIQFKFAIDYRLLLAQFYRVLSSSVVWGICCLVSTYLVLKKYNELNWPFELDRVNGFLERSNQCIVPNAAYTAGGAEPHYLIQSLPSVNGTFPAWNENAHGASEWTKVTETCFGYAPKAHR